MKLKIISLIMMKKKMAWGGGAGGRRMQTAHLMLKTSALESLYGGQFTFSYQLC